METNSKITCIIENGNIFSVDYMGVKSCVGVNTETYKALESTLDQAFSKAEELQKKKDEYYNMLIEAGVIKKEKTLEEIQQENIENQNKIMDMMNSLFDKFENFENRLEGVENGHKQNIVDAKGNGSESRQDKPSNKTK